MARRMGERGGEKIDTRPGRQIRAISAKPAFDRERGRREIIDTATGRVGGDKAGSGLAHGAGIDRKADRTDTAIVRQGNVERDAAAAGPRTPLNTGVRIGEAGMLCGGQRQPENVPRVERTAHDVAAAPAASGSSFSLSATISDRAALVARRSG